MHRTPVIKLFLKLLLLSLPALVVICIYLPRSLSPYQIQSAVLQDKIDKIAKPQNAQLLIGGESRALHTFIPGLLTQETGLASANLAVGTGYLLQYYEVLKTNSLLNGRRIILISVSSYEINDGYSDNLPAFKKVVGADAFGIQKLLDMSAYYNQLAASYFYDFKRFMRRDRSDPLHIDQRLIQSGGYSESTGTFDPATMGTAGDNLWYKNIRTGGAREQDFVAAIKGFAGTNDTVIIYNGPLAPSWRKQIRGTVAEEAERHFDRFVQTTIAPYPNMHYLSLALTDTPELTDADFGDITHVNATGAPVVTNYVIEWLRQQKILK